MISHFHEPYLITTSSISRFLFEDFKLEKGPTDKANEPDPGGSDQQNLGYKKLKNRKTDRTVGLNYTTVQSNRRVSFSVFQFLFEIELARHTYSQSPSWIKACQVEFSRRSNNVFL